MVIVCRIVDLILIIYLNAARGRDSIIFWTQCILLSTTSTPTVTAKTSVLELKKLQLSLLEPIHNPASSSTTVLDLPSLDNNPISSSGNKPWTYMGTHGHPTKVTSKCTSILVLREIRKRIIQHQV